MHKVLIAANLFLDIPLAGCSSIARGLRRQELLERLESLVEETQPEGIDGVIIAGNLLYRSYPSPTAWNLLNSIATKLAENGVAMVVLEGELDKGPLFSQENTGFFVIKKGETKEFLPGLPITVGSENNEKGIVFWRGETPPPTDAQGGLILVPGNEWDASHPGRLVVSAPYTLDFDGPNNPALARVTWDDGPTAVEIVPFKDRMYATVRWDIDEQGMDIASYLQERQDVNLALKVIITGQSDKPLPIESWEQFAPGYFMLQIEDHVIPTLTMEDSPLAGDEFQKRMVDLLDQNQESLEEIRRIKAAWMFGSEALKGGSQRED